MQSPKSSVLESPHCSYGNKRPQSLAYNPLQACLEVISWSMLEASLQDVD